MKHIFSCLTLLLLITSCAVKDEGLAKLVDPNNNPLFYDFMDEQLYSSDKAIWVDHLTYDVRGADVMVFGMCCAIGRTPTVNDHFAYAAYQDANVAITGLEPNTTYVCRAFLSTTDGVVYYSDDKTIKTQAY